MHDKHLFRDYNLLTYKPMTYQYQYQQLNWELGISHLFANIVIS